MSRLNPSLFIARRLSSATDGKSRGTMIRISIATTALSIAVMIVSLAVVRGFKHEISAKVDGFVSQLQITALTWQAEGSVPVERIASLEESIMADHDVTRLEVYATCGGVLKTDKAVAGITLKGIDADYNTDFWQQHLTEGTLPRLDTVRNKDIMVSASLSALLDVAVGDKVEFMFISPDAAPRRDRFRVCGIYNTGFGEMDKTHALTDLRNVQRLLGWSSSEVTGYEIRAKSERVLDELEYRLYMLTVELESDDTPLMVTNTRVKYPTIFDWLKAHDVNAAVIITIMFAVALLSALSALLIMLLERTRTIGILKALGMNNGGVQGIFMYRSLFILVAGVVLGDVLGVALCMAQKWLHIIKLDSEGYFLSEVPIAVDGWSIVVLNVGMVVLMMAALALPTLIISKIKPDKTIRFQ